MTGTSQNRQAVLQDLSGEAALCRLSELATEFGAERIASTARSVAERVSEGRFYVACIGQFKRGKSTLLNALIGHSILPTGVIPVTALPTIIRYGRHLGARVRFQGATWTDIPVGAVEDYVSEKKNPENAKGVAGVEIYVPSPLLETGMCLVDTPGLGSVFAGNTAATNAFVPHIDAAIVVVGADPPLSWDELQLVDAIAKEVHDLIFVLNKADRTSDGERTAAIEFTCNVLERRLQQKVTSVFEVSALERSESRGPNRDWDSLVQKLEDLVRQSGLSLVRDAGNRAIRHTAEQLLAVIREERDALRRPAEESEQRIARLRETVAEGELALGDLGALLAAEQDRLSRVFLERREAFLKQSRFPAQGEFMEHVASMVPRRNGPAIRRDLNHLAQKIVRAHLGPWLDSETRYAEELFCKTSQRFIDCGNDFLHRLAGSGIPGLESLPEELNRDQSLQARSHFYFNVLENVAAPASPFLLVSDLVLGILGLRGRFVHDAQAFVDHLLEVNSSRVQYDVDERVRESRRKLETGIRELLREASAIAERALARARTAQAAGASAVEGAVVRLAVVEREIRGILSSGDRVQSLQ
jgi:GTPase Era involved in 16S rRNA processing